MQNFLIGRQQIFNRDLNVFAYELLFRCESEVKGTLDGTQATIQVILDSLLEEGLECIVGKHRAFINVTRDNLLDGIPLLLPKERVVIEIVEGMLIDAPLIEAVRQLSAQGYRIALDDFIFTEEWRPLVAIADIIKLDVRALSRQENVQLVEQLKPYPVKLLAEKIETLEEYRFYRQLGCEYYQGFFFNKPNVVHGKRISTNQQALIHILAEINKPNTDIPLLAKTIAQDVGLSYKLLRYINSAFFSLPQKIDSIRRAIVLLGLKEIKRWANLLALATLSDKPDEFIHTALTRAKMCESLALLSGMPNSDEFFLVGLLSTLDRLLDTSMESVIKHLPLAQEVQDALLFERGMAGAALRCVVQYERWNLAGVQYGALDEWTIGKAFLESISWANKVAAYVN